MSTLDAHGIEIELRRGWDVHITLPDADEIDAPGGGDTPISRSGTTNPLVHMANFALPVHRGDFGQGATQLMRSNHVFIAPPRVRPRGWRDGPVPAAHRDPDAAGRVLPAGVAAHHGQDEVRHPDVSHRAGSGLLPSTWCSAAGAARKALAQVASDALAGVTISPR